MGARRLSLNVLEKSVLFDTRVDIYVDGDGNRSLMRWIPLFTACRALTSAAAAVTPSGTIGDWFHSEDIQTGFVENTDYFTVGIPVRQTSGTLTVGRWYRILTYVAGDDFTNVGSPRNVTGQWFCATGTTPTTWTNASVLTMIGLGGFWVDMFLCSSPTASMSSIGQVCNGSDANRRYYVSQPNAVPMIGQNIEHFRQYLAARFSLGGFVGGASGVWSGRGGLITDAHWNELWLWTRINRWLLRGNTNGANASNRVPQWHSGAHDVGMIDPTQVSNGASLTGGNRFWEIPISDFCGNRWEFTEGLRINNGAIYTAGKTINPYTAATDTFTHASWINTSLSLSGITSGQSAASYRTESLLTIHGIPATSTTGVGGFDGQGIFFNASGERVSARGGSSATGSLSPGALSLENAVATTGWQLGARAILIPLV